MHGDLYFEKAVNGFLYEMFRAWQETGASHEVADFLEKNLITSSQVTIVLFSRTFYTANEWSDFPEYMQECLQQDYKGR